MIQITLPKTAIMNEWKGIRTIKRRTNPALRTCVESSGEHNWNEWKEEKSFGFTVCICNNWNYSYRRTDAKRSENDFWHETVKFHLEEVHFATKRTKNQHSPASFGKSVHVIPKSANKRKQLWRFARIWKFHFYRSNCKSWIWNSKWNGSCGNVQKEAILNGRETIETAKNCLERIHFTLMQCGLCWLVIPERTVRCASVRIIRYNAISYWRMCVLCPLVACVCACVCVCVQTVIWRIWVYRYRWVSECKGLCDTNERKRAMHTVRCAKVCIFLYVCGATETTARCKYQIKKTQSSFV